MPPNTTRFRTFLPVAALAALLGVSSAPAAPPTPARPEPILSQTRYDGDKVVRVTLRDQRDVRTMLALSEDPWTCNWSGQPGERLDFRVPAGAIGALEAAGIPYTVLVPDVQVAIDAESASARAAGAGLLRGVSWFADYKDLSAISAYTDSLIALRPDMVSRFTVRGANAPQNTAGGRTQFGIRVSAPGVVEGTRPALFINSLQHAREWVTGMSSMYLADTLVRTYDTDANIKRLLDGFDVYIIPVMNPDGYEYTWTNNRLWRKNRRQNSGGSFGVDPNRNWGQGWGGPGASTNPSDDTYRGTAAFSEPETANVRDWMGTKPNIVYHVDIHSYSQLVLEPWGDVFTLPPDTTSFAQLGREMVRSMYAVDGRYFYDGPIYRNIYPASGGACDWTTAARGAMGFSFELRDEGANGFLLPAAQIVPSAREVVAAVQTVADWMLANPLILSFPGERTPPSRVVASSATPFQAHLSRGLKQTAGGTPVVTLFQRIGRTGPFTSSTLTNLGTDETGVILGGSLIAGVCGSVVQFAFEATAADGSLVRFPAAGTGAPFEAVANASTTVFADDFEAARGWTVGDTTPGQADTATSGQWTRVDPNGTLSQAEFDHTPLSGVAAFVTGQNTRGSSSSTGTVTGGKTTVVSPVFDLSAAPRAEASFWVWFNNTRGGQVNATDAFAVDATSNASAAAPTWTRALTIGPTDAGLANLGGWRRYSLDVGAFTTLTNQVRLRFVARKANTSAIVEAGLDDFALTSLTCATTACASDFNGDGVRQPQDIFDFLNAFFSQSPSADFDASGTLQPADIFAFLNAYFLGCP